MRNQLAIVAISVLVMASAVAQVPLTSTIATGTLLIRGRFVDADTGAPLQRCSVRLTAHQSTGYNLEWASGDWTNPPEQTTGADGTFRFVLRLPAADEPHYRGRYHIRVSQPHHAGWFSHCTFAAAEQLGGIDYGDVRLPKGVRPRIRCVDTMGTLQPGVTLYLKAVAPDKSLRQNPAVGPHSWVEQHAYARTDIDGYLHLSDPLPPGKFTLSVRGRELLGPPKTITLPRKEAVEAIVTRLLPERVITGRVVDEAGNPLGNVLLGAPDLSGPNCVTRRDGAFTLVRASEKGANTASIKMARNRRYDSWVKVGTAEWGATDAEFVVPTLEPTTFVVTDEQGVAVEKLNIYCLPAQQRLRRAPERISGTFAGGRATCRLEPGEYRLLVSPRTNRVLPSGWQRITVEAGKHEHSIRLLAPSKRAVSIVFQTKDGEQPVTNALVEVITGLSPGLFAFARPITSIDNPSSGAPDLRLVASAHSDELGNAQLRLADPGSAYLRISGVGIQTQVLEVDLAEADQKVRLEVQRGTRVSGQVKPLDALRHLALDYDPNKAPSIYSGHSWSAPTVTLIYDNGNVVREGVRLDHEGRFVCEGVAPGEVEVQLRIWKKVGQRGQMIDPTPLSLGSFEVGHDKPTDLQLQLPKRLSTPDKR